MSLNSLCIAAWSPQSSIMMETMFFGVLFLSGCHISTCLLRQYHFVAEVKTWTEAQTYCRQMYTDLATVDNAEEMDQLISTVSSAGHNSDFWTGLYSEIDWRWSDGFTGNGSDYSNWDTDYYQPNYDDEFCVVILNHGKWHDVGCQVVYPFICYRGTQLDPEFVAVNEAMTWSSAQRYCRENYIDLATVRNDTENQEVQKLVQSGQWFRIGLFRDPVFYWSDQREFSFSYWDDVSNLGGLDRVICGVASLQRSGKWRFLPCERKLPFVCYSLPAVKRQVVKLRINAGSSVDLNDPVVKADLLKKLQEKLKENGVTGVNLKWRVQPDGKVFHKEEKSSRKKQRKNDEL